MEKLTSIPFIAWDEKNRMINTEYGTVRYEKFCQNEVKRMNSNKKVIEKGNLVCVN